MSGILLILWTGFVLGWATGAVARNTRRNPYHSRRSGVGYDRSHPYDLEKE
jgi:hypothetical protein